MAWFKVDDNLHSHEKARKAGLAAMGLWAVSGSHSGAYLAEGWVPRWYVAGWPSGIKLAAKLVAADLWIEDGEGWRFHQWDERNPSKRQVEADRLAARERQKRARDSKRESRRDSDVTDGVSNGVTSETPTRPDPFLSDSYLGGESLDSSGPSQNPPPPEIDPSNPRCIDHRHIGPAERGPSCAACGRVRQLAERQAVDAKQGRADAARRRQSAIDACPWCDIAGWLPEQTERGVVRCDHVHDPAQQLAEAVAS